MTYHYRDPQKCTGYVPALPPRTVFRRSALVSLDPFAAELFAELMAIHFADQATAGADSITYAD